MTTALIRTPRLSRALCLAGLLACGAPLACARDLGVPQLQPPTLKAVTPSSAFAGERVLLSGTGLGNGSGATVQIGGRSAEAAPSDATLPGSTLAVLLPEDLAAGPLDVTVTTQAGKTTLAGAIRTLGLGHPSGLGLQGRFDLGVYPWSLSVLGDQAWISDLSHDEMVAVDPLTGGALPLPPLRGGINPSLVFGTQAAPWLYSGGDFGHHPQLDRFDLTGAAPVKSCSSGELAMIGDGSHPALLWNARASDDGTLLVALTFGSAVALIDTSACPVQVKLVTLPQKAWGVAVSGREVLVALTTRFARIKADGAVVVGPVLEADAAIGLHGIVALDRGGQRLAYVRADDNIGFVDWDTAGGAPVVEDGFIFTYGAVQRLAYGPRAAGAKRSDRLYLRQNERLLVYDVEAAPALVATAAVDGQSMPITVLNSGEVLTGIPDGTSLYSRDGALLRTWVPTGNIPGYGLGVGGDGRVLVPSDFGVTAVLPDLSGGHTTFDVNGRALQLDGLTSSEGPPIGWAGNLLFTYAPLTHDWTVLATLPAGRVVSAAGRDATGSYYAAYGYDGTAYWLEVFGPAGATPVKLPAVDRVRLSFGGGVLWLLTQTGATAQVYALDPASPRLEGTQLPLDPVPEFVSPRFVFPFWSRALGELVVPVVDVRDTGNGTDRKVAAVLQSVAPGKSVRRSALLSRSLSNPVVLSPDGRMLVSLDQVQDGVDTALLSLDGTALRVTWSGHTDLPARATDASFSAAGDALYVTLPSLPALGELQ